jgi:CRISP-associated protein Cas1
MRKMLNTLFVTTPDAYLSRDGDIIVVKVENEERFRIPVHNIEGIVSMGYMGASPSVMALCSERKVALSFVADSGKFLGRVVGPVAGNVLLRRKQYRAVDDASFCLGIAKLFVAGKIANSKTVLQRALRYHTDKVNTAVLEDAIIRLSVKQKQVMTLKSHC